MILHKALVVKEELINIAVLTKLISNYCLNRDAISVAIPIESLILEINVEDPDIYIVDVKPLIMEQVILAVSKVLEGMEMKQFLEKALVPSLVIQNLQIECREYVAISSLEEIFFIKMADILYCKADGKYTKFYTVNGETCISSKNIGDYENRVLDSGTFFRIHNSYIINMRHLNRIVKIDGHSCEMQNGQLLPISKRRMDAFYRFIKIKE